MVDAEINPIVDSSREEDNEIEKTRKQIDI
jgi:hypothetical protein